MYCRIDSYKDRDLPEDARSAEEVSDHGFLQLAPGMALFQREVKGLDDRGEDACALDDDIQAWVADETFLQTHDLLTDADWIERLKAAREETLGPAEDRTDSSPSNSGDPKGGIALERLLYQISSNPHNHQGQRCYSMGYSFERPRSLAHPSKNMKQVDNLSSEDDMRRRLLDVSKSCVILVALLIRR